MDIIDLLVDHDAWATSALLTASAGLSDEQFDQRFDIGHGSLRETFGHMIFNIPFWTAFLNGGSPEGGHSADAQPADRSLAALTAHHEQGHAAFAAAAKRLRDEGRLSETYTDHYAVRKSFAGTILMVIEHNEGHRVELLHILARLGVHNLPEIDLGAWEYLMLNP